jgi:CheY-like chemotaxis protein
MDNNLVIIAEDEPAYGKILQSALVKEGCSVEVVPDGAQLLSLARSRDPKLIVLDMIMPVKNGFEVLIELKNDEQLKTIPVIALSNLGQEEDIEKAKKLGAGEYIVKSEEPLSSVVGKIKAKLN